MARRMLGRTAPNPAVGAIIADESSGRSHRPRLDAAGRAPARRGARAEPRRRAGAGQDHVRHAGALLAPRAHAALRRGHPGSRCETRRLRHERPQPRGFGEGIGRAAQGRRRRRGGRLRGGGALDGSRPYPAHDQGPAVRAAQDCGFRRWPDRAWRRRAALGHRHRGAPARACTPGPGGRCPGRPQDGRGRRPRAHLPPARARAPLAAARRARRQRSAPRRRRRSSRPPSVCR